MCQGEWLINQWGRVILIQVEGTKDETEPKIILGLKNDMLMIEMILDKIEWWRRIRVNDPNYSIEDP